MKKKGFTLAEVLIALGIIGVVSAFMIPAIGKAKPDKTKLMYLKSYDALTQAVKSLANDTSIYSTVYTNENAKEIADESQCQTVVTPQGTGRTCPYNYYSVPYSFEGHPLLDITNPVNPAFSDSEIASHPNLKFARLLSKALDGKNLNCTATQCAFATKGNLSWSVLSSNASKTLLNPSINFTNVEFGETVILYIDKETTPFSFYVLADGSVIPADVKGQAYIKYRKNPRLNEHDADGLTAKCLNATDLKGFKLNVGTDIQRGNLVQTGIGEETVYDNSDYQNGQNMDMDQVQD